MQQMQNRLMKMQEELAEQTVEATAGGGVVKAVATGQQKIVSLLRSGQQGVVIDVKSVLDHNTFPKHIAYWRL